MKYGHRNVGKKQPEISNLNKSGVDIRRTIATRDLSKGKTKPKRKY